MNTYEVLLFLLDAPKDYVPTIRGVVHATTPYEALKSMVEEAGKKAQEPYFVSAAVLGLGHLVKVPAPFGVTVVLFEPKLRVGSLAGSVKPEGAPARRASDHYRVKLG